MSSSGTDCPPSPKAGVPMDGGSAAKTPGTTFSSRSRRTPAAQTAPPGQEIKPVEIVVADSPSDSSAFSSREVSSHGYSSPAKRVAGQAVAFESPALRHAGGESRVSSIFKAASSMFSGSLGSSRDNSQHGASKQPTLNTAKLTKRLSGIASAAGLSKRFADRFGLGKDQTSDESVPTSDAAEVPYTPEIPPPPPDPLEVDAVSDMLQGIMQDTRFVYAEIWEVQKEIVHSPAHGTHASGRSHGEHSVPSALSQAAHLPKWDATAGDDNSNGPLVSPAVERKSFSAFGTPNSSQQQTHFSSSHAGGATLGSPGSAFDHHASASPRAGSGWLNRVRVRRKSVGGSGTWGGGEAVSGSNFGGLHGEDDGHVDGDAGDGGANAGAPSSARRNSAKGQKKPLWVVHKAESPDGIRIALSKRQADARALGKKVGERQAPAAGSLEGTTMDDVTPQSAAGKSKPKRAGNSSTWAEYINGGVSELRKSIEYSRSRFNSDARRSQGGGSGTWGVAGGNGEELSASPTTPGLLGRLWGGGDKNLSDDRSPFYGRLSRSSSLRRILDTGDDHDWITIEKLVYGDVFCIKQSCDVFNAMDMKRLQLHDNMSKKCTFMPGEGLHGAAWLAGKNNEIFTHVLEAGGGDDSVFEENPAQQSHRMAAIHTMFSAVVGLPLMDTTNPLRVSAICMLFLSASDKANITEYVESRKCEAYLLEIANILPVALEFSKRVSAFKIRSTEVTSQRSARTLLLWKALRGVVKTGWIRQYDGPVRAKKHGLKGAWHKYKKERDFVIRNLIRYLNKWKGQHHHPALGVNYKFALMSSFGGFVGMTAVSTLHDSLFRQAENQYYFLIASFAAVATVIFALPASPYAQPRTVMGAHLICCVSGLLVNYFMTEGLSTYFLPRAVGLALVPAISIGLMQRFGYTCPPAAATGIIFLMDNDVRNLGWWYILFPCISGCAVLIFLGLVINNMSKSRVYPVFW